MSNCDLPMICGRQVTPACDEQDLTQLVDWLARDLNKPK